jgi:hypothetical protein
MLRFVDLRGQGLGGRFAYFDTVTSSFHDFDGEQTFSTWAEFEEWYMLDTTEAERLNEFTSLDRFRGVTPRWAFEPVPEDYDDFPLGVNEDEPRPAVVPAPREFTDELRECMRAVAQRRDDAIVRALNDAEPVPEGERPPWIALIHK